MHFSVQLNIYFYVCFLCFLNSLLLYSICKKVHMQLSSTLNCSSEKGSYQCVCRAQIRIPELTVPACHKRKSLSKKSPRLVASGEIPAWAAFLGMQDWLPGWGGGGTFHLQNTTGSHAMAGPSMNHRAWLTLKASSNV